CASTAAPPLSLYGPCPSPGKLLVLECDPGAPHGRCRALRGLCRRRRYCMMAREALIAPHVQAFFAEHLCHHKRVSPQTMASYRDTLRLLLNFVKDTTGKAPSTLQVHDLGAPMVLQFLDYLEHRRGNAIRSRNMRLAAIRSFARFLALRDPTSLAITTRVLA